MELIINRNVLVFMRLHGDPDEAVLKFDKLTVQTHGEYIPVNDHHSKYDEYSQYGVSELLLTDRKVVLSFKKPHQKDIRERKIGIDVNFSNLSMTVINEGKVEKVLEKSTKNIVNIQNDYSRRRRNIEKHIRNPQKRHRKLKGARGRQKNREERNILK